MVARDICAWSRKAVRRSKLVAKKCKTKWGKLTSSFTSPKIVATGSSSRGRAGGSTKDVVTLIEDIENEGTGSLGWRMSISETFCRLFVVRLGNSDLSRVVTHLRIAVGVRTVPVPHGPDGSRTRAVPDFFQPTGRTDGRTSIADPHDLHDHVTPTK